YAAGTWDRSRRVIMKAERLLEGPNRRFVVTSLDMPPQSVYDEGYTPRGDMENRIKEQQLMLFADRTSCHAFLANQFRLLLSSFAYVLLHHLRAEHLA
ncbi:transposase, partial [Maioricimonas sp. JC845]|uniref:transposase n=1 Tax=Maioricimonas sp. JC845 TaxID=3232138 RepID=UPI003458430F